MDALANGWVGSMDVIRVWACTGQWMGWWHGRYQGLDMDALAHADLSDRESRANEGDEAYKEISENVDGFSLGQLYQGFRV